MYLYIHKYASITRTNKQLARQVFSYIHMIHPAWAEADRFWDEMVALRSTPRSASGRASKYLGCRVQGLEFGV